MLYRLVCIFLLVLATSAFAQVEVAYRDISLYRVDILRVVVSVKNLGPTTSVATLCRDHFGQPIVGSCEFTLRYEQTNDRTIITLPASGITIMLGLVSMPMDVPIYNLPTTGTMSGERWEVLFDGVPYDAGDLTVSILGVDKKFGDMPGAQKAREVRDSLEFAADRARTIKELDERRRVDALVLSFVNSAEAEYSDGDYLQAARDFRSALSLDEDLKSELSPKLAVCYSKLAERAYTRGEFEVSIDLHAKARLYSDSMNATAITQLGDSYLRVAEKDLARRDYSGAGNRFRDAITCDSSLRKAVDSRFRRLHRSPNAVGIMSLVPGGGQLRNHQFGKAAMHLGVFTVFAAMSAIALSEADKRYDDYLMASNGASAVSRYNETTRFWRVSVAAGAAAVGVIIWSIHDAHRTASLFNKNFEIVDKPVTTALSFSMIAPNSWGLRICVPF
jgi:tetratricopeptide (TPR) repeat protein